MEEYLQLDVFLWTMSNKMRYKSRSLQNLYCGSIKLFHLSNKRMMIIPGK